MIEVGLSSFVRKSRSEGGATPPRKRLQTLAMRRSIGDEIEHKAIYQDILKMLEEADLDSNSIARARRRGSGRARAKRRSGELWQLRQAFIAQ